MQDIVQQIVQFLFIGFKVRNLSKVRSTDFMLVNIKIM